MSLPGLNEEEEGRLCSPFASTVAGKALAQSRVEEGVEEEGAERKLLRWTDLY